MHYNKKRTISMSFLIVLLILSSLVSMIFVLCLGAIRIPFEDTFRLLYLLIKGRNVTDDLRTVYRVVWLT